MCTVCEWHYSALPYPNRHTFYSHFQRSNCWKPFDLIKKYETALWFPSSPVFLAHSAVMYVCSCAGNRNPPASFAALCLQRISSVFVALKVLTNREVVMSRLNVPCVKSRLPMIVTYRCQVWCFTPGKTINGFAL